MTKDSLLALLLNYLRDNITSLSSEDRFLIHILSRHLATLILPDRNQDIKEQLPEIITNALDAFITSNNPTTFKIREDFERILERKISVEEDKAKIIILVNEITKSEPL